MISEKVILVNEQDESLGVMDKLEAHKKGLLHRAFSVFIFNSKGELLLQQRALSKYHSPGLWTNTCCSHPRPGEKTEAAAHRRLIEEMGFDCELKSQGSFIYKVKFENDLYEHELDHVLFGNFDGEPVINPTEVNDYRWVPISILKSEIQANSEGFTFWLKEIMNRSFW